MENSGKKKTLKIFSLILIGSQIIFLSYTFIYLYRHEHLPPPFFFDAEDTFMDFYHTNYWSYRSDPYQDWHTIYPLFTFLVGRFVTTPQCQHVESSIDLRACAISGICLIFAGAVAGALICGALAARRGEPQGRTILFIIASLLSLMSLPLLFAVERGNYIVLAFTALAAAELCERNWKSALWHSIAINFKPYLVILWLVPLIKRRYDLLIENILFTFVIQAIAFIIVGFDHYYLLIENILGFANTDLINVLQEVYYTTSYGAWLKVLKSGDISQNLSSVIFESACIFVFSIRWIGLGLTLAALWNAIRERKKASWERLYLIIITALLVATPSPGGYALICILPYISKILPKENSKIYVVIVFVLMTPLDWLIGPTQEYTKISFFTHHTITYSSGVTLLAYIRPFAMLVFLYMNTRLLSLSIENQLVGKFQNSINCSENR